MAGTQARNQGESRAMWMLGGLYEVILSGEETGGAATVMQMTVPVGGGPPPHVHDSDELVAILEGRGRYHYDGRTVEHGPGTTLFFPRGTEETFEPLETMKLRIVYSPGGVDRFFGEFGEPAARRELPPPMTAPPDIERLVALGEKYGLHVRLPVS